MRRRQPLMTPDSHRGRTLPRLWLLSDLRNDDALEAALAALPCGSGFIYRHYHLAGAVRRQRFDALSDIARRREHSVFLAGSAELAREWHADGTYGAAAPAVPSTQALGEAVLPHIATAHNLREIRAANISGAAAIMLSPVFATRSHPGGAVLGPQRFAALASHARAPVIALGGMNAQRARRLRCYGWAAIDGLSG